MSQSFTKRLQQLLYPDSPPCIQYKTKKNDIIKNVFESRNWRESEQGENWNIFWSDQETLINNINFSQLNSNQKVNHFLNSVEITQENLRIKNIRQYKEGLKTEGKHKEANSLNFFPKSYFIPQDYERLIEDVQTRKDTVWIVKPMKPINDKESFFHSSLNHLNQYQHASKSDLANITQAENFYIQEYLTNSLLIGGKQFVIKTFCLVKSFSPLTAYLYRDGFANFRLPDNTQNTQGKPCDNFINISNIHLKKALGEEKDLSASTWNLRSLKAYLVSKYGEEKNRRVLF